VLSTNNFATVEVNKPFTSNNKHKKNKHSQLAHANITNSELATTSIGFGSKFFLSHHTWIGYWHDYIGIITSGGGARQRQINQLHQLLPLLTMLIDRLTLTLKPIPPLFILSNSSLTNVFGKLPSSAQRLLMQLAIFELQRIRAALTPNTITRP
jgi:hypothetical protein